MNEVKLSVIIINYNSSKYTLDCIATLQQYTALQRYEIVVIDNNSAPEDREALSALSGVEKVKLHRSRINLGFSGGNMLGLQFADPGAEYLFFLNNDCLFKDDAISKLISYLDEHPGVAACTGQIFDGQGQLEQSFDYLPEPKTKILGRSLMRKISPARFPKIDGQYDAPIAVPVITGCAMMLRSAAFAAIGGFDTNLFLYCEEEDLCKRLNDAGYGISFVPSASIIHLGGKSSGSSYAINREFYISFFYYFRKHYGRLTVAVFQLMFFFKNFRKGFRRSQHFRLALFILRGAPVRESLRFLQKIS